MQIDLRPNLTALGLPEPDCRNMLGPAFWCFGSTMMDAKVLAPNMTEDGKDKLGLRACLCGSRTDRERNRRFCHAVHTLCTACVRLVLIQALNYGPGGIWSD